MLARYRYLLRALPPRPGRWAVVVVLAAAALAGCGGTTAAVTTAAVPLGSAAATSGAAPTKPKPSYPAYPVVHSLGSLGNAWHPVVSVRGQTAAWIAQRDGVALLRFDQSLVRLALHAGSVDPGPGPWRYGDAVRGHEAYRLVAAFNSGFKLSTGAGGWESYGHTAIALSGGRASVVTYRDGSTDIGAWTQGVPARKPIASVRQNLYLLVNNGVAASTVDSCVLGCWGATLGGGVAVARSALGIDARHRLIYAATESATPGLLAQGLIAGGVRRAAELDINPAWVAAYLYHHGHGPVGFIPVIPGQYGVAGHFLAPYSRDFFSIIER
jgi:hypothetical protein